MPVSFYGTKLLKLLEMRKMKLMLALGLFVGLTSLIGCVSRTKQPKAEKMPERLIGNSKDAHGCALSAGYQWSELLKDCIRPFEIGVKLSSQTEENATFAAFLVFNTDSSKVEVFMPKMKSHPILKCKQTDGQKVWSSARSGNLKVQRVKGNLSILQDAKVTFAEE